MATLIELARGLAHRGRGAAASAIGRRSGRDPGRRVLSAFAGVLLLSILLGACDSLFGPDPRPTTVIVNPTSLQFAAVGETATVEVDVLDQDGKSMQVNVVWSSSDPDVALVSGGVVTAVGNGTAQITARAGEAVGTVTVVVKQVAATLWLIDGEGQTGAAGEVLPRELVVEARDSRGYPAAGVAIRFTVEEGGGSLSGPGATGPDGRVSRSWTLGTEAGAPQRVRVALEDAPAVTVDFHATAVPGAPASVEKVGGDQQVGRRLAPLAEPLSVRVRDRFGNLVPGAAVQFSVTGDGGTLNPAEAVTGADGVASSVWTLGTPAGEQSVAVHVGSLPPVTFSATAVVVPSEVEVHAGQGQGGIVGQALTVAPAVRVLDDLGSVMAGVPVRFEVTAGGGTLTPPAGSGGAPGASVVVSSGEDGVAALGGWTLGTTAGTQTLLAVVDDVGAVEFVANAAPGPPAIIEKARGDAQTGTVGQMLPQPLVVRVTDTYGNPVQGVTVSFQVVAGGGSVNPVNTSTNASGLASTWWTLGPGVGTHTVTASIPAGSQVTFSAQAHAAGSPPPPSSGFDIQLHYIVPVSESRRAVFEAVAARWASVFTAELSSIFMNLPPGNCGSNAPALNGVVDDLLIFVTVEPIDGERGTLASAGPCWIRTSDGLPIVGRMRFDSADLDWLDAQGLLYDVILHEMGHVLGIGSLWSAKGLLENPSLPSSPGVDTHFSGPTAIAAFDAVGGASYAGAKVPVENDRGGPGTRDSHWRESVLGHELMTGFINTGGLNPLSRVTLASLQDLGYQVDLSLADPYTLPAGMGLRLSEEEGIELRNDVDLDIPIRAVDEEGRVVDGLFR